MTVFTMTVLSLDIEEASKTQLDRILEVCRVPYAVSILLSALIMFVAVCVVLIRTRGLAPIASLLVLTPLPLLLGVFTTLHHIVFFYQSHIETTDPLRCMVEMLSYSFECAVPTFVGLIASSPAFIVAAIGLFVRALRVPGTWT